MKADRVLPLPTVDNPTVTDFVCGGCGCPEYRRVQIITTAFGHVARLECYDCARQYELEILLGSRDFERFVDKVFAVCGKADA